MLYGSIDELFMVFSLYWVGTARSDKVCAISEFANRKTFRWIKPGHVWAVWSEACRPISREKATIAKPQPEDLCAILKSRPKNWFGEKWKNKHLWNLSYFFKKTT